MISVKAEPTQDVEYIASVLFDDEMFERISEDDQPKECIDMSAFEGWIFVKLQSDSGPVGVFGLKAHNSSTFVIHAHVPKEHREKYAKASGAAMMRWMDEQLPERTNKIIAEIPVSCESVYWYTKSFGFQDEGVNRASILKGGEFVDQYRLGITREEISEWLGGNADG